MLDWVTYILVIGAVGFVTFGLVYLLFAELFRGPQVPENRSSRAPGTSLSSVTEVERISLTRPGNSRTLLTKTSAGSCHKESQGTPSAEDGKRPQ